MFIPTSGVNTPENENLENDIKSDWHSSHVDGQLAVDVLESREEVVVISTMAGADPDNIDVSIHGDVLTIKGSRKFPIEDDIFQHHYKECFWGNFSRTVILPVEVDSSKADAEYKNGVLVVKVPIDITSKKVPIKIVEE